MTLNPLSRKRKSIRLKEFDYSQPGAYFVTICTRDREHIFGEIVDGEMRLNANGQIVEECWETLPSHYPNMELDAFIVMPNHVHGIIVIHDDDDEGQVWDLPLPEGTVTGFQKSFGLSNPFLPDVSMPCATRPVKRSGNATTSNTLSGTNGR